MWKDGSAVVVHVSQNGQRHIFAQTVRFTRHGNIPFHAIVSAWAKFPPTVQLGSCLCCSGHPEGKELGVMLFLPLGCSKTLPSPHGVRVP